MPEDTAAPLLLAIGLGVLFVGLLLKVWLTIGVGLLICLIALLVWLWPRRELREREPAPSVMREPARG